MNELSAIEQLDIVLKFLSDDRGYADLSYILNRLEKDKNFLVKFDGDNTIRILDKLHKDGYVDREDIPTSRDNIFTNQPEMLRRYWISFEGKVFVETGGYKEAIRKENIKMKAIENAELVRLRNDKRLVYGTWAVAVGAIALVVWEMIKTFYLEHC